MKNEYDLFIELRINEIFEELNTCREDDRNTHTRILEVISVVGTILGILLGTTFFSKKDPNDLIIEAGCKSAEEGLFVNELIEVVCRNLTYVRVIFLLSLLVFCAAFAYIIKLGMSNALRYYYIQNLEDRLYDLQKQVSFPDDRDRGRLLHWKAYMAPITTLNLKHITSTHTGLHFLCYVAIILCLLLFSLGILVILFLQMNPKKQFDYLIITIAAVCILISFLFYFRFNLKAWRISKFAWDTAHENQELRLKGEKKKIYGKAKSFWKAFFYFLYPRKAGLWKSLLIFAGFIYRVALENIDVDILMKLNISFFWFVFDFLVYQARYQINDIRGLDDVDNDQEGQRDKDNILNVGHMIKLSRIIIFLRIAIAGLFVWFCTGQNQQILLIGLIALVLITILYEIARKMQFKWLVFIFVGLGYPLRFFVGYFSIGLLENEILLGNQIVCIALTLWAYGVFASLLVWSKKITVRMQWANEAGRQFSQYSQKKHYKDIQAQLIKPFNNAKINIKSGKIFPLREKGRVYDYWNIFFILSLLFTIMLHWLGTIPAHLIYIEILAIILFGVGIYCTWLAKLRILSFDIFLFTLVMLVGLFVFEEPLWYMILVFNLQMLIVFTLIVLGYRLQVNIVKVKILKFFKKIWYSIWGQKAMELLKQDKENLLK